MDRRSQPRGACASSEPGDGRGIAPWDAAALTSDRQRFGFLLVTILCAFVLQGVGATGRGAEVAVTALASLAVVIALWAADAHSVFRWLSVGLAVAVTVLSAANPDGAATRVADALMVSVAPPVVALGVIRGLQRRGTVTIEAVLGVLCIYLLIGLFFAFVFGAVQRVGGDAFFAGGQDANAANAVYFSFTSLTTVGYGDLTAASNLGHTLAVSEALIGQVYLVTVVSVLVGNLRRRVT